jgi:hypothetical protein
VCSRFTASLLIVLVVLPFTEPFASCDLSILRSSPSAIAALRAAIGGNGRAISLQHAASSQSSASMLQEEQFKDALLAPAASAITPTDPARPSARFVRHTSIIRPPLVALRL